MSVQEKIISLISESNIWQSIENVSVSQLAGDASSRSYFRVKSREGSCIVSHSLPENSSEVENFCYWSQVYLENDINVPKIIFKKDNFVVQEDLGEVSLFKSGVSLEYYQQALDQLIKIQSIPIPADRDLVSFDRQKFNFEFGVTRKYYLEKKLGLSNKKVEDLMNIFSGIHEVLVKQKLCLSQRDYHSKNIMIKEDKVFVIDFQDTLLAVPQYDLVSLLEDCYVSLSLDVKRLLIKKYWQSTSGSGNYQYSDFENFNHVYNFTAIQRIFKAIGSFCMIDAVKGDSSYLVYVNPALENMKMIIRRYEEFGILKELLREIP